MKNMASCYLEPLEHIINLSMTTGIAPYELKKAIVIPLFKNGDPNIFNNYRPISLLPIFSKVIEKVIYARCISFLKKKHILYEYQFGFRGNHSTNHALSLLLEKLAAAHENGEKNYWFVLGFFKSF